MAITFRQSVLLHLKAERGISFEEVVFHIDRGDIPDVAEHPGQKGYRGQRVYLVPCVHDDACVVLKAIIPSRKATRQYPH